MSIYIVKTAIFGSSITFSKILFVINKNHTNTKTKLIMIPIIGIDMGCISKTNFKSNPR
jgi:hypothetical protein